MQEPTQDSDASSNMKIARVANWLWQQAGRPAGRYIEFWTKVEQALIDAEKVRADRTAANRPSPKVPSPERSNVAAPARSAALTVWEHIEWEQPILHQVQSDIQATNTAVRPARTLDGCPASARA